MTALGYYVDSTCHPDFNLDQRVDVAALLESEKIYGWRLVEKALDMLNLDRSVLDEVRSLWRYLCSYVHPSTSSFKEIASRDLAGFVTDSFNAEIARELLKTVDRVFDLVYYIILKAFSRML